MTEETVLMAEECLVALGFVNKQSENTWNMVQLERDCRSVVLKVWGRHWYELKVQAYGSVDNMIELCETKDKDELLDVVGKAIVFFESLPPEKEDND